METYNQVTFLRRLWHGQYSLRQSFWGFYVIGGFLIVGVAGGVSGVFIFFNAQPMGAVAAAVIIVGYVLVATVGTWRSASNYPLTRWWPTLAKFVILIWTTYLIAWFAINKLLTF